MQKQNLMGEYIKICGLRKDEPFFVLGPNKITCILTMVLVNIVSGVMLFQMNRFEQAYVFFTVHMVILVYLDLLWIATGVVNPGIISKSGYEQLGCRNCKQNIDGDDSLMIRQHCKRCQVCIEDRQHHCSLTGGCIGHQNKISYYFFLLGIVLYAVDFLCTAPYIYYLR